MAKQDIPNPRDVAAELGTICDFMRYAVSRFGAAGLHYGHGTDNAFDEAAFLIMETLHMTPDMQLEPFWTARLTEAERSRVAAVIEERAATRKPAPYLTRRAWIQGVPFYVDERAIVPRSYIGELLMTEGGLPFDRPDEAIASVLDLCTGSGCLAVLAAMRFANATVDAADLSPDALDVARRNVGDHGLENRITLHQGDLFSALPPRRYDLIISNPPYVDAAAMADLPPEYRHEPSMALGLAAGADGLSLVNRIFREAADRLNPAGALLCEIGRCREALEKHYPKLNFTWLETSRSTDEVLWITRETLDRI